ncbi:Septin [Ramicandelaber brevisporus]|nr:Septin [Ramicandelaber brevisporus]
MATVSDDTPLFPAALSPPSVADIADAIASSSIAHSTNGSHSQQQQQSSSVHKKNLNGFVGFCNLPNQVHRRSIKKGFHFTLMVVGESGLGKSTLVNTLFNSKLCSDNEAVSPSVEIPKTVDIQSISAEIDEGPVKLRLTVVDTPGFGDFINNDDSWKPILENIEARFDAYLAHENRVNRSKIIDNRVHACLYFIKPTGHALRAVDIEFMKRLHTKVNLIPIIAKADTLTEKEIDGFKERILADIQHNNIQIFRPMSDEYDDAETVADNREILEKLPFAIVGSNTLVESATRGQVRGRQYPWGVIEVENEDHCDFVKLRQMLIRTHMEELKEYTDRVLYEHHRTAKLLSMGHTQDNSVFREYNPAQQAEEEKKEHEKKMAVLEKEMSTVFAQKVQEKEAKLKQSEEELHARHREMKAQLERQRLELEEKKRRLDAQMRPITPSTKPVSVKKSLFK